MIYVNFQPESITLNIMVVGAAKTGKTTALRSLIPGIVFLPEQHESRNKTTAIYKIGHAMLGSAFGSNVTVNLIDSPGYGDQIDSSACIQRILRYVKERHFRYLDIMHSSTATMDRESYDERIHLCLYFITPHTLDKEIDTQFITALSSFVNIIPIISKADSLTHEEKANQKRELQRTLLMIARKKAFSVMGKRISDGDLDTAEKEDLLMNAVDMDVLEVRTAEHYPVFSFEKDGKSWIDTIATARTLVEIAKNNQGKQEDVEVPVYGDMIAMDIQVAGALEVAVPVVDAELPMFRRKINNETILTDDSLMQFPNIFAIVSGIRVYPWGTVESSNGNHSDLPYLQHAIFKMYFIDAIRCKTNKITDGLAKKQKSELLKSFAWLIVCFGLCVLVLLLNIKRR